MRRIVDVFVRDRLRASYPVVIEEKGRRLSEKNFTDYVRRRMTQAAVYSADDIKVAKFIVREARGSRP